MVGLAFAVAASANFPALLLSVTWKKFTTAGAVAGIATGLLLSVVLIILSPTVWTDVFKFESAPPFPMKSPALISLPASFIVCILVSLLKPEPEAAAKFDDEKLRTYAGIGAE
jgi:cation/acetate symporter